MYGLRLIQVQDKYKHDEYTRWVLTIKYKTNIGQLREQRTILSSHRVVIIFSPIKKK